MENNILLLTDVYKIAHMVQYCPGITKVYSYLCARSIKKYDKAVVFGLQYYLKKYLSQPITHAHVDEFLKIREGILGPDATGVIEGKLRALAELGYLPLEIKAVPEGTVVGNKNVLLTISNTIPEFYWCGGYFESLILKLWNTVTVASNSRKLRLLVEEYADETCGHRGLVPFQVHDFGYRGVSSEETAVLSGMAHLTQFLGTDTVPAVAGVIKFYGSNGPIGLSVGASEHSVMCSYGKENEFEAFERMLELYPTGIVSIVSDTYNLFNVLTNFLPRLKDKILARDGKVVIRPDSGNPKDIILGLGYDSVDINSPESKGTLRLLEEVFGSTINSLGYKELNPKIGLIYGDGMYYDRFEDILETMRVEGWASSNLVVGIGGLLLQQHNRDDMGFAIKATYAEIDGVGKDLFKDPITDPGKKSHTGCMKLIKYGDVYLTIDGLSPESVRPDIYEDDVLQFVFRDGKILKEYTFDEIRERAKK